MNNQPECKIDEDGTKLWSLNRQLHREDGPAVEYADGGKEWWLNGKPHREGGPAIEDAEGDKIWFLHGECHCEDGPAVEDVDGSKQWFLFGEEVEPENVVDYNLAKGIFCYYDEQTEQLIF